MEVRKKRELDVVYGRVKDHDGNQVGAEERSLLEEDPVLILIEFGKMMGFRLIDLFASKHLFIRFCLIFFLWIYPFVTFDEAVLYEPHRDKTNKMACAPSEDSDQPGNPLHCALNW